ncbi:hypothetical protein NHH03_16735 [Stieleria sp. TO1_6]|uniref:hypothetical protein n=1 Tax=Stieleria tagensis TaxID=2956795 RepID=UPI00209B26BD|nr:hypothetical protein [Stieleria tagensis]MCO8123399.1 hypothetical protein [Stieleria tagensis]
MTVFLCWLIVSLVCTIVLLLCLYNAPRWEEESLPDYLPDENERSDKAAENSDLEYSLRHHAWSPKPPSSKTAVGNKRRRRGNGSARAI